MALAARRARALSRGGAAAAIGVGTAAVTAGWSWAILLLLYFVTSVGLTRFRAAVKESRTAGVVAKRGARDAAQVLANGGVFALAAVLWALSGWDGWHALGAGAIAAATSDTWATEVGTLSSHAPRSVIGWRPVPAGTSGAVSRPGLAAAAVGAAIIGLAALTLGWGDAAVAAVVGGIGGSTIDSLLGATVQARRWCDACGARTERERHTCGSRTRVVGGIALLDNDGVNALSTMAGGLIGLVFIV